MSIFDASLRAAFCSGGEDKRLRQKGDNGISGQEEDSAQLNQDHRGQGQGQVLDDIQDMSQPLMSGIRRCGSGYGQNLKAHSKDKQQQYSDKEVRESSQEHEPGNQAAVQR